MRVYGQCVIDLISVGELIVPLMRLDLAATSLFLSVNAWFVSQKRSFDAPGHVGAGL